MGICFSKKKEPSPPSSPIPNDPQKEKVKKNETEAAASLPVGTEAAEQSSVSVSVSTHNKMNAVSTAAEKDKTEEEELPEKRTQPDEDRSGGGGAVATMEELRPAPMRSSSCTREELDAILIQCGHLSRSASGNGSNAAGSGGHHRRYSGSKRSYDFDNEKGREGDEDWDKPAFRPSPRRRTPSRERGGGGESKRSGSRERGSGGGRRVSRSPGRRSDGPPSSSSACDKSKHPGKMVSVPAISEAGGVSTKRASSPAVTNKRGGEVGGARSSSPRSRSPANTTKTSNQNTLNHNSQPRSLGRSSPRAAEHSPHRRNPLAEIDENTLRSEQQHKGSKKMQTSRDGEEEGEREPRQLHTRRTIENNSRTSNSDSRISNRAKGNLITGNCTGEQPISCCRVKEPQPESETVEEAAEVKGVLPKPIGVPFTRAGVESLNPRSITSTRSSRRASRDLDHNLGLNPETVLDHPPSYNSILLQDIQNYHTEPSPPAGLALSKASSILGAAADLSSFSENKGYEAEGSNNIDNGRFGRRGSVRREAFAESKMVLKDDLMEPSLHKYVTIRGTRGGETEPQESAGSNSFVSGGQPWDSPWEPNSVGTSDRYWTSQSLNSEEAVKEVVAPVNLMI